jgi:pyruvate/2-oxoglutarate dehydrogenase complex dihydrolipoamide dehydrogenase (E3) component/uncharacterized membrane protein YdjX (TVP38/TMEM64 family)
MSQQAPITQHVRRMSRWRVWAVLGFFLLPVLVGFFFAEQITLQALREHQQALIQWQAEHPWPARGAYAAVYLVLTSLSLPSAAVLTLAGGAIFGLQVGVWLVLLSATAGATLSMLMTRYVFADLARHRLGPWQQAFEREMARDGNFYLLFLRLLPVMPFFLVNIAMGLSRMPVGTYALITLVGMAPATLVYVQAGTALATLSATGDVWSTDVLLALTLLAFMPLLLRSLLPAWRRRRRLRPWRTQRPQRFDRNLVVIGAGAAGLVSAYMARTLRARVTLIEAGRPGGDCLYRGCVPSKTLIEASRQIAQMRRAADGGLKVAEPELDWPMLMQRLQQVIRDIEPNDSVERYTQLGVDVRIGRARIVNPWTVEIATDQGLEQLTTRAMVVATGSEPIRPDLPGLDQVCAVTSDTLWDHLAGLHERPNRVVMIGGGAMGCELSQALARLGAEVTLVERGPRLLAQESQAVSQAAHDALADAGVRMLLQSQALECRADGPESAPFTTRVQTPHGEQILAFDLMILAMGRKPRWQGFGLEALGIQSLDLDEYLETAVPGLYAAGDVAGGRQMTHLAAHQGWHAALNALQGFWRFRPDRVSVPQVIFMDPEIARAGLTLEQAQQQGLRPEVVRVQWAELDRAVIDDRRSGFIELMTRAGSDRLLGVTIVGTHAGELLPQFTLAMNNRLGLNKLLANLYAYPTLSEIVRRAAAVHRREHQPRWLGPWLERWHAWRRG